MVEVSVVEETWGFSSTTPPKRKMERGLHKKFQGVYRETSLVPVSHHVSTTL